MTSSNETPNVETLLAAICRLELDHGTHRDWSGVEPRLEAVWQRYLGKTEQHPWAEVRDVARACWEAESKPLQ